GVGAWLLVRWLARKQTLTVGKELGRRLALAAWACKLLEDFADAEYAAEHTRITEKHARKRRETDEYYRPLLEKQKAQYEAEIDRLVADHAAATESIRARREAEVTAAEESYHSHQAEAITRLDAELKAAEDA